MDKPSKTKKKKINNVTPKVDTTSNNQTDNKTAKVEPRLSGLIGDEGSRDKDKSGLSKEIIIDRERKTQKEESSRLTDEVVRLTKINATLKFEKGELNNEIIKLKAEVQKLQKDKHRLISTTDTKSKKQEKTIAVLKKEVERLESERQQQGQHQMGDCQLEPIKVMKHLLKGIASLHKLNIVHGNINLNSVKFMAQKKITTTENLETHKYITVTSDFGLKTSYSAPETRNEQSVGADIFSLGVLSHQLLMGKHPFDNDQDQEILVSRRQDRVLKGDKTIETEDVIQHHLLEMMLDENYTKRPSANALLKGPLFWDACKKMTFLSSVFDYYEYVKYDFSLLANLDIRVDYPWLKTIAGQYREFMNLKDKTKWDAKYLVRVFRNCWSHFPKLRRGRSEPSANQLYYTMSKISPNAISILYQNAVKDEKLIEFLAEKSFRLR